MRSLIGGGRGHFGSAMSIIEILRVLYDDKTLILCIQLLYYNYFAKIEFNYYTYSISVIRIYSHQKSKFLSTLKNFTTWPIQPINMK